MNQVGNKWACHPYPDTVCPDDPVRLIAHGLRAGKYWAVMVAARAMAKKVPAGSILVPIPSADGGCYANRTLAHAICLQTPGVRVVEALRGSRRRSQYDAKKSGVALRAHELKIFAQLTLSDHSGVVLIDNVLDTGETYRAACAALGAEPPIVVWAMTPAPSSASRFVRMASGWINADADGQEEPDLVSPMNAPCSA